MLCCSCSVSQRCAILLSSTRMILVEVWTTDNRNIIQTEEHVSREAAAAPHLYNTFPAARPATSSTIARSDGKRDIIPPNRRQPRLALRLAQQFWHDAMCRSSIGSLSLLFQTAYVSQIDCNYDSS